MQFDLHLLNSIFKFKTDSKLYSFITAKTKVEKTLFTLAEILTILKNFIRVEGLYDEHNPSIILCSRELEDAFNMKGCHVTEVRDMVLRQLIKIENDDFLVKHNEGVIPSPVSAIGVSNQTLTSVTHQLIHTANISNPYPIHF